MSDRTKSTKIMSNNTIRKQVATIPVGDFLKMGDTTFRTKEESHIVIDVIRYLDRIVNPLEDYESYQSSHKFDGIDLKREWIVPQIRNDKHSGGGYWDIHRRVLAAICEALRQQMESESFLQKELKRSELFGNFLNKSNVICKDTKELKQMYLKCYCQLTHILFTMVMKGEKWIHVEWVTRI